jgi:hypothetical protein
MSELQSAVIPLFAALIITIGVVWLAVVGGDTKTTAEWLKTTATTLFGAALMAFQSRRKETQTQTTDPEKSTQTTTTQS